MLRWRRGHPGFPRRASAVVIAALTGISLVALWSHAQPPPPAAPTSPPPPATSTAGVAATPAPPVATATPSPPPDPLAACRRDPAGLPALPPQAGGRPATTFHTCGAQILNQNGELAQITGVSWFGMETGTFAPHGLWTRNWQAMLDQIAALGFNTIRLPFSNDALVPGRMPQGINYDINPDLAGKTSLEVMDRLILGAADRGLKVILDRHRPTAQAQSELWYTDAVSEQRWIQDWVMLAGRYRGNPAVLGVDLHNEPRGPATWGSGDPATDWRLAAERAGNAVLDANPDLLIFVQGVERSGDDWYWWGGNLEGARSDPVRLNVPGRLVYSPHDYGPGVYPQSWFWAPDFPNNLPALWDAHWGYLVAEQRAPVVLGEFGGRSVGDDADGVWQRTLMDYATRNGIGWLNWSFNPDSSDTGGLLSDDWLTVVQEKAQLYLDHVAAPLDVGASGVFGKAQGRLRVRARATSQSVQTTNPSFAVQVINDGPSPVNLRDLELRYWFSPRPLGKATPLVDIDYAPMGATNVHADVSPPDAAGVSLVRLRFADAAGSIQPYQSSGEIAVRLHKSDWSSFDQRNDYSFQPDGAPKDWDRIGLYRQDQLVWGVPPPREAEVAAPAKPRT